MVIAGARGKVFYFDSQGLPPFDPNIISFISNCKRRVVRNKNQIQPLDSALCPLYAMFMALYLDWYPWNESTRSLPVFFSKTDFKKNDRLIKKYMATLLDKIMQQSRWKNN